MLQPAGLEVIGQSNLGEGEHNYRVPDSALHPRGTNGTWHSTAALLIEVVSPNDEVGQVPFYAAHDVDEVLIVDPAKRSVDWLALTDGEYRPVEHSGLIDLGPRELAERIESAGGQQGGGIVRAAPFTPTRAGVGPPCPTTPASPLPPRERPASPGDTGDHKVSWRS